MSQNEMLKGCNPLLRDSLSGKSTSDVFASLSGLHATLRNKQNLGFQDQTDHRWQFTGTDNVDILDAKPCTLMTFSGM
jgi:hypothetical protein